MAWAVFFFGVIDVSAGVAGKSGFDLLKISPFPRSAAMAEATTAVVGDPSALYSNPAGLAHTSMSQISAQHAAHLEDVSIDNLAMIFPYARGGWGLDLGFSGVKDIAKTKYDPSSVDRFVETGEMKAGDQFVTVSWGRRQTSNLALGVSVKAVQEKLDTETAMSVMGDVGGIYRFDRQWRGAVVVQNMGSSGKFISEAVPAPLRGRAAVHWTPEEWMFWEVDGVMNGDGSSEALLGGEFHWEQMAFFRLGYRYPFQNNDLGIATGFSVGVGFQAGPFGADYAFLPYGDLGDSHRFAVSWRFGNAVSVSDEPPPDRPFSAGGAASTVKKIVAVADFEPKNVSSMDASITADFLRSELAREGAFAVVSRPDMDRLLAGENVQMSGCTTKECAVRMAKILNADKVVMGSVALIKKKYSITANIVDVEAGFTEYSTTVGELALDQVPPAARDIAQKLAAAYQ